MIVGFREFEGQFSSRLEFCVGAVLVSQDGVQYECVKRSNYGAQWKIVGGQGDDGCVSIVRMRELVGDGAVSDMFVDSCVELFFRVLRARGCVVDDDAVRLALSGAAGELVCAVLPGEQSLASLSVDAVAAGLARVGDIVCGAAISVETSDDMMGEALRISEGARLIAAASGDLP